MKATTLLALSSCLAVALTLPTWLHADDDDVISDAMKTYHKAPKGTDPVAKKAAKGEASAEELADLLAAYQAMAEVDPPQGDADAWKEKMTELVAATQALVDGEDGALDSFKEAGNCKSCHTDYKPD